MVRQYAAEVADYFNSEEELEAPFQKTWEDDLAEGESDEADHCFVCGRFTDHVGEHDDLLDAGAVLYVGGSVLQA